MAISASKSKTLTSSNSRSYTLTASFTESSYSVANSTSTLSLTAKLTPGSSRWSTSYSSTLAIYWYDNYTGKETLVGSTTFAGLSSTSDVKSVTKSYTVTHKSDGSLSGYAKAVFTKGSTTSAYAPASGNVSTATTALTKIPRTSVLGTISSFILGNSITIPITKYSSSFTDTLTISLNGTTIKTVSGITNGTTVSFTSSELTTIYKLLPSATSGTFNFKLATTYNGSTIGTSSKTATGTIPTSVAPTISSVTISEANTSVLPTSTWGVYVQNKTKLKFVTSATAGSGSSISSVTVSINGGTYTGTTITTNTITASGNLTATITAKDSRGRTASTTKAVTILAYSNPYISSIKVVRSNSSGNASDTGTYAKVTVVGGYSSVSGKNKGSYKIYYKKSTALSYSVYSLSTTTNTVNEYALISDIDTNYSYQFYAAATDSFTTIKSAVQTLSTALVTTDYLDGGKGIAFGKVAETSDLIDVNFDSRFRKTVTLDKGHVVHIPGGVTSGTSGYVKFATITVTATYCDAPIYFKLAQRHKNATTDLYLRFVGGDTTDPKVSSFMCTDGIANIYIQKSATSTWDLYMQKSESYDSIWVLDYAYAQTNFTISWAKELVSSVPSGYIQARRMGVILPNEGSLSVPYGRLVGTYSDGSYGQIASISSSNNIVLGHGSYSNSKGSTNLYGNYIQITAKETIIMQSTLVTKNAESIMALNSSGTKKALIGISEGNNLYIGSATSGNATGNTNIYASAGQVNINGTTKTQFGTTSGFSPNIYLGYASGWATASAIGSYWADSTGHEILTKSSDGLTTGVGWAGSTSYTSVVNIRSMSCNFRGTAKWSSDKNLKKDIVSFDDKMEEFYDNLNPVSYKYILGNSGRPHCGFVAQSVEEALNKAGLSTDDFAGITIDTISQRETEQDEDGNDVDIYGSEINYLLDNGIDKKYCLAYNEFVALNTWQIQKLKIENKEFKTLLQEQQKIINDLSDKYNQLIIDNN